MSNSRLPDVLVRTFTDFLILRTPNIGVYSVDASIKAGLDVEM